MSRLSRRHPPTIRMLGFGPHNLIRGLLILCIVLLRPALGQDAPTPSQRDSLTAGPIRFEEIAAKAGLNYVTANGNTENKNQPQTMVAGVALFDYDGDGYLDVYLVGGAAHSLSAEGNARLLESSLPQQS